jgi:hypothetical protein
MAVVSILVLSSSQAVRAQAIGYQPVIASFPDGVIMDTTPVVSADRRYVRIGVNAQFAALVGLTTYNQPLAAAAGGAGRGGLGGLGGGFGGLGGGGGGGGGAGGGGGRVAGLNGLNGPDRNSPMGHSGPLIAFHGMGSPEASAVLSGTANLASRPMLSAGMPGHERPKTTSPKKTRTITRKRR